MFLYLLALKSCKEAIRMMNGRHGGPQKILTACTKEL